MRVCQFWALEWPEATASLPAGAERVWTGGDEFAYWRELKARWTGESDLVVVEHDIIVRPDVFGAFAACQMDWCVFGYDVGGGPPMDSGLGCTRFSAALQQWLPFPGRADWRHLDGAISAALAPARNGVSPHWRHVHYPQVRHLHYRHPEGAIT